MEAYAHLKTAEQLKEEGNGEFRAGRHAQAVAKYRAALKKKSLAAPLRATLLCNVAVCLVRLERWEEAVDAASDCLKGDDVAAKTRAKALLFRSRAFRGSPHRRDGGAAAAVKDLEAALALDPAQAALRRELADATRAAPAAAAPARVAVTTGPRDDDVVGEARLLDDAALKGALKGKALYGADEQRRRYVAPPAAPAEPPREWVQARMKEALERKKAESGDMPPTKAYRATASGGVVPTWQRTPATAADAAAVDAFKLAAPELLPSDFAAPEASDFNRGYREVDVSVWCRRRLFARLRRLEARYADAGVRDGAAGVVRLTPSSVHGDALMVRVGERWDRAYDLGARFDFEARLGAPRTKDVVMKGKKQRVFMGVPTVRGRGGKRAIRGRFTMSVPDRSKERIRASRTLRVIIARPKLSRNERKSTERGSWEVRALRSAAPSSSASSRTSTAPTRRSWSSSGATARRSSTSRRTRSGCRGPTRPRSGLFCRRRRRRRTASARPSSTCSGASCATTRRRSPASRGRS